MGLKRLQGPGVRKRPVPIRMLESIGGRLRPEREPVDAVPYCQIITVFFFFFFFFFFFLMRVGEYACAGYWNGGRVQAGLDVAAKARGGAVAHLALADEV
eukprot:3032766-Pyramimonas_sp.AAC.1